MVLAMIIKLGHIIWDKDENRWNNCVMFVSKVANCDHKLKGVFCHLIFQSKNFYKIFKDITQPAFLCVLWMFWLGLELSQIISANIFFFISLISNRTKQTTVENGEFMALQYWRFEPQNFGSNDLFFFFVPLYCIELDDNEPIPYYYRFPSYWHTGYLLNPYLEIIATNAVDVPKWKSLSDQMLRYLLMVTFCLSTTGAKS